jgi:hypothetical protein
MILFFWRIIGLRILPIWKLAELPQDLSRNFRCAVWWSVATACYIVWLFRFITPFSITLLYYLCKIIHILLFITTNIWLQHNFAYPRTRIIRISDAGEVLFCYGFLTRDVKSWIETVFIGCKNTRKCWLYPLFARKKSEKWI